MSQQNEKRKTKPSLQDSGILKLPPQDKEAERVVLGTILIERDAMEVAMEYLRPDDFYLSQHASVYEAMIELKNENQPIDLLTTVNKLKTLGQLESAGGPLEVMKLTSGVVSSAHLVPHCLIVKEKATRRKIIEQISTIYQLAYDDTSKIFEVIETAENAFNEIGQNFIQTGERHIGHVMLDAVRNIEHLRTLDSAITGVKSGFTELDLRTRGWQKGDLIIVAARPSVGKTAFALNLVRNAGVPVAIFSLEMKAESQAMRMIASEARHDLPFIQTGRLTDQDMEKINQSVTKLSRLLIYFDDSTSLTVTKFRAAVRRMVKKHKIGLVVVDYLQLMQGDDKGNREQEISKISRALKTLAMELDVPVIALSQLSREVEKRSKPIPILADLRESGAIEQDADLVLFLYGHTEEEIKQDSELSGKRYVKIAKQRNGTLATIDLNFVNGHQIFTDKVESQNTWRSVEKIF